MRIVGLKLQAEGAWPALEWNGVAPGLNAVYGPNGSGKTSVADFLGHVLFGKRPTSFASVVCGGVPQGEATVDSGSSLYRLRRYHEGTAGTRLTVAGIDGSSVDEGTIRNLVGGLSPTVLAPLCAVSFADAPQVSRLLSPEFLRETRLFGGWQRPHGSRRTVELAARRDLLAQELETRIANERRVSTELDGRWRELDRRLRHEQQQTASLEQRLRAVETALAETDARLRYRRLELNIELHRQWDAPADQGPHLAELDAQIAHWRTVLGDLSQREAAARGQLSQIKPAQGPLPATLTDQAAWLTVARQLAADLSGEVARLARASDSQRCVCGDAHPRLRPIAETIERQLDVLETLIADERSGLRAREFEAEIDNLGRTQAELRHYLEQLLDRREALSRTTSPSQSVVALPAGGETGDGQPEPREYSSVTFSSADAQQLESRRLELEQERFDLVGQLRDQARTLRELRSQRDAIERERAALLSARSIEHVQRELADVQRRLEQAATGLSRHSESVSPASVLQASDFLAQLSDGGIVRMILEDHACRPCVVDRGGRTLPVESLTPAQRDQVYLSVGLSMLAAAAEHGIWLPLVLDEPCLRLDAGATAALAAVLDDFCRRGHQVLVFTERVDAVDRLTSLGGAVQSIVGLRRREFVADVAVPSGPVASTAPPSVSGKRHPAVVQKRKKSRPRPTLNGKGVASDQSDAA